MSEGSAEGGGAAPLSDGQFGDVTQTGDLPQTSQNPGNGIWAMGFYPWSRSYTREDLPQARRRKKRKKSR